jgi:galactitol-specific phosphotransferase system IIC component
MYVCMYVCMYVLYIALFTNTHTVLCITQLAQVVATAKACGNQQQVVCRTSTHFTATTYDFVTAK